MKDQLKKLVLLTSVLVGMNLQSLAQTTPDTNLSVFSIELEQTANGIKMRGQDGTHWLALEFALPADVPQAVDAFGMVNLEENPDVKGSEFLFTITQTRNGLELKGVTGTAWIDLSFTLNPAQHVTIDQYGMHR